PPATPKDLVAIGGEDADSLTWSSVSGAARYEVFREDRVVASTTGTSVQVPSAGDGARYFVRAVDAAGNRSATTGVAIAEVPEQPVDVITAGGSWSYYFDTAAPASGWQERDFDDSSWSTGTAPLGWGHANLGTELTFTGTKPLVSYY